MSLFLVTCVCDAGVYANAFRVVEAPSRLAVAAYIWQHPSRWEDFLRRSGLWEAVRDGQWSAEELLKRMDATWVDGDSRYQMSVHTITTIEPCARRETRDEGREDSAAWISVPGTQTLAIFRAGTAPWPSRPQHRVRCPVTLSRYAVDGEC